MINKYGYVRVSTKDQNEDRQLEAMKQLEISEKNILMQTEELVYQIFLRCQNSKNFHSLLHQLNSKTNSQNV